MEIKEIRTLSPEERQEYHKIDLVSFAQDASSRPHDCVGTAWGAFVDDEQKTGKLCAGLTTLPFTMEFDSRQVKTHGVASVVVLPEYREKGITPALMKVCMENMRAEGVVFSALYPFSFDYYRRFGYELVYKSNAAEIPMEFLEQFSKPTGVVRQFEGEDFSALEEVYSKFKAGRQLALTRDARLWKKLAGKDPLRDLSYTYILYDGQGAPSAYLVFHKIPGANGQTDNTLVIDELAYTTSNAIWEMFGFIKTFRSKFCKVHMPLPFAELLFNVFPEADQVTVKNTRPFSLMLRIINLPAAFNLMALPDRDGSVVIDVSDEFLPQNAGRYELSWENGKLTTTLTKTTPDLEVDITALTQLLIGFITPAQALYRDVKINSKQDILQELFPLKDSYIFEEF